MRSTVIAIGIVIVCGRAASADPTTASRLYAEGQRAYKAEDYGAAAAKFEAAYAQDPDPVYLFNAAQAYRLGEACVQSAAMYRRFLDKVPNPPNADKIKAWHAQTTSCARLQTPHHPPAGESAPEPPSEPRSEPRSSGGATTDKAKIAAIVVGGLGVVSLGLGVKFTLDVGTAEQDRAAVCPLPCEWAPSTTEQVEDINRRGERAQRLAIATYAIGGAALVTGIALYMHARSRAEAAQPIAIAPTVGGAMVVGGFTF